MKIICILLIFTALSGLIFNIIRNMTFEENHYTVLSEKVGKSLRILHLSDLHSSVYGKENEKLINRIEELRPDVILMTGDIIDRRDDDHTAAIHLCRSISGLAPCYYVYGNNECRVEYGLDMVKSDITRFGASTRDTVATITGISRKLENELKEAGITVLFNETASIRLAEANVDIYGILLSGHETFPTYGLQSFRSFIGENPENLKITLCHEPYIFEEHEGARRGDLILSGHTHGGIIRLPFVGGVIEKKNGIFPELKSGERYIGGYYESGGVPLIVSRGATNRGIIRIGNRPEIIIIDVKNSN